MIPVNSFAALALQAATHPVQILKVEGKAADAAAATGLYLQLWDSVNTPSDTPAVLKKTFPIYGGGGTGQGAEFYKEFKPGEGEAEFQMGMWVGVSTTEATFTAATGNNKWSTLEIELRSPEAPVPGTVAGDLSSNVTQLQVWSAPAGQSARKRLMSLEIDGTNLIAGDAWLMLFAKNNPVSGTDTPLLDDIIPIVPATVYTGLSAKRFGKYGREMKANYAGSYQYGCTAVISSTAPLYTVCGGTALIRAEYITAP